MTPKFEPVDEKKKRLEALRGPKPSAPPVQEVLLSRMETRRQARHFADGLTRLLVEQLQSVPEDLKVLVTDMVMSDLSFVKKASESK